MSLTVEEYNSPLKEKFRSQVSRIYLQGTIKIGGFVLSDRYRHYYKRLKNFEVRDDDVWIITYPKCGTTWTQEMVWLLMNDLDYERAKEILFNRSPFVEYYGLATAEDEEGIANPDTFEQTERLSSPRCIKSHMPKDLLPDQLWTKKPKIIYVTRSAKDTLVSHFSHQQLCSNYKGTLSDFVEVALSEEIVMYDPFWKHILDFWKMKDEPNILINSFEEMKKDLPAVIKKTAKFLGKSLTEEQLAKLVDHLSFKSMKANPAVNFAPVVEALNKRWGLQKEFMRKGEAGSGSKELTAEQTAKIDKWSLERIKGTGYPFVG